VEPPSNLFGAIAFRLAVGRLVAVDNHHVMLLLLMMMMMMFIRVDYRRVIVGSRRRRGSVRTVRHPTVTR